MEWKEWIGKEVFIRTKHEKVYSGVIIKIDDSLENIIFISLIDKFGDPISLVNSEIVEIKEEKK